jgi:assimilatory nitrate reductase catalytic subunit
VYLADNGAVKREWLDAHTTGFADSLEAARQFAGTPAQVAAITKLPPEAVISFYEMFAGTERVMSVYSQGVNQSSAGTDKVNAIINCHLATARIGRRGMGPFSVTGQPNAMGGREVGGLANQLAAHMNFESADVDRVRRFWRAPNIATRPGLKAVELFDAVLDGRIKAVWIAATNPAASMPRAELVRRALQACPFVVVSDCWPTDTTKYADVVLPACGWGEKDGTVTNSERRISRQRAFRHPPGEAKPDWWMFAEVGRRMGWIEAFSYDGPAQIFREHAALSGFENAGRRGFDIGALARLSDAEYQSMAPMQWPVPADGTRHTGRFFADGGFFTPDRKARFIATPYKPIAAKPDRRKPFLLNSGRIRDQWHTMTRTGLVPRLMSHQDEPFLELHPHDAMKLCVEDGDLLRVETEHASTILRAKPNPALRIGEVFAPMHWTDDFVASGPVARLVSGVCDPISGQPELKATAVRLAPIPTLWRGLLLLGRVRRIDLPGIYYARIPYAQGQAYELRGWEPLPREDIMPIWANNFLDPGGERIETLDRDRGSFRFANVVGGRLQSCLLLTRDDRWMLPERGAIVSLLGAVFDKAGYDQVFRLTESAACAPRDRKVCSCFAIGRLAIEQTIIANRLTSCAQIGAAIRAGTNCGSCIPEIEEILRDIHAIV